MDFCEIRSSVTRFSKLLTAFGFDSALGKSFFASSPDGPASVECGSGFGDSGLGAGGSGIVAPTLKKKY